LLPSTPSKVIIAVFLLAVSYLSVEGLKNIGRICEVSQYLVMPLLLTVLITLPHSEPLSLMPVGRSGIQNILRAVVITNLGYSGAIIYMIAYPFNKTKERALGTSIVGVLSVIFIYVLVVAVATMVFGIEGLKIFRWPLLELMRITTIPVIERLDFFVLIFYQLIIYRITSLAIFNAGFSVAKVLGLKEHTYAVLALLPIIYIIALLPKDAFSIVSLSKWAGLVGISIDICYPLLLLLGMGLWVKKEAKQ
jgi:spore germination protein